MTGAPALASAATCARSGALADRAAACSSGKPPPMTRPSTAPGSVLVPHRVERDDFRARGGEQLGMLGVAERERRPARDGDAGPGEGRPHPFGGQVLVFSAGTFPQRAGGAGEPQHRVQVHAGGDDAGQGGHRLSGRAAELRGGDEPEVAGGNGELVAPAQHAEDRDAGGAGRLAQQLLVTRRAGLVEDHAADARPGVPGREAVQQGGGRRADAVGVDDEDDRRVQQPRHVRRRREVPPVAGSTAGDAVEQAHHALDDRDVGGFRRARPPGEHRRDLVLADQPRVEVAAGPARGERVVARVDVVRADLVRRDRQAPRAQRARAGRSRPTSCRARCRAPR